MSRKLNISTSGRQQSQLFQISTIFKKKYTQCVVSLYGRFCIVPARIVKMHRCVCRSQTSSRQTASNAAIHVDTQSVCRRAGLQQQQQHDTTPLRYITAVSSTSDHRLATNRPSVSETSAAPSRPWAWFPSRRETFISISISHTRQAAQHDPPSSRPCPRQQHSQTDKQSVVLAQSRLQTSAIVSPSQQIMPRVPLQGAATRHLNITAGLFVLTQSTNVTDGRTDRYIDRQTPHDG